MSAPALLPLKAFLARAEIGAFRAALATIRDSIDDSIDDSVRDSASDSGSLRDRIAAWAGDHGLEA